MIEFQSLLNEISIMWWSGENCSVDVKFLSKINQFQNTDKVSGGINKLNDCKFANCICCKMSHPDLLRTTGILKQMVLRKDNLMNYEELFNYDVNIHLYYDARQEKMVRAKTKNGCATCF